MKFINCLTIFARNRLIKKIVVNFLYFFLRSDDKRPPSSDVKTPEMNVVNLLFLSLHNKQREFN